MGHGPKELELLFRAIVYYPSAPILITDDDGNSKDASTGAAKLLGRPREQIIGRPTPPLRDRPEDIPILVRHFTKKYAEKMGRQIGMIP